MAIGRGLGLRETVSFGHHEFRRVDGSRPSDLEIENARAKRQRSRTERLARELCRRAGNDPDAQVCRAPLAIMSGKPTHLFVGPTGPAWHAFVQDADDALAALADIDAAKE